MDNLKWNHKKYLNIPEECREKRNKEKNLGGQTENKQNRKKKKTPRPKCNQNKQNRKKTKT